jgi:very-short-patch-repair endonuclease
MRQRRKTLLPREGEKGYGVCVTRDPDIIARARRERRALTGAEEKLWRALRDRRFAGVKIRRQHPVGPFVADFACVALRLIIEADGPSHDDGAQMAFDARRTAFLAHAGWRVARISNADILAGGETLHGRLMEALKPPAL